MESLLENLLMETGSVETDTHTELDVTLESLVRRRSPNSIRIESLVKDQPQIQWLIIEEHTVAFYMNLSHTRI